MIDPTMVPVFTGLTFEQLGQTVLILIAKCDALQARLDAMAAQPVQPAGTALQKAAQAVLDRWNSPKWEWVKQGPTADLMDELRRAIEQTSAAQPAKQQSQGALDAARSAEQGDIKDAQRLDYCYQQAMGAFMNAPITKQQWLNGLDAAIAARGAI